MRFERGKKHIQELKILYKLKQKPYFSKFNPTLHLKIKFHLHLSNSCHQKVKKYVTWGLKSQMFHLYFMCNPMEPFIGGVRLVPMVTALLLSTVPSLSIGRCSHEPSKNFIINFLFLNAWTLLNIMLGKYPANLHLRESNPRFPYKSTVNITLSLVHMLNQSKNS